MTDWTDEHEDEVRAQIERIWPDQTEDQIEATLAYARASASPSMEPSKASVTKSKPSVTRSKTPATPALTIESARLAVQTQHPGWNSHDVESSARGMLATAEVLKLKDDLATMTFPTEDPLVTKRMEEYSRQLAEQERKLAAERS